MGREGPETATNLPHEEKQQKLFPERGGLVHIVRGLACLPLTNSNWRISQLIIQYMIHGIKDV